MTTRRSFLGSTGAAMAAAVIAPAVSIGAVAVRRAQDRRGFEAAVGDLFVVRDGPWLTRLRLARVDDGAACSQVDNFTLNFVGETPGASAGVAELEHPAMGRMRLLLQGGDETTARPRLVAHLAQLRLG